MSIRSYTAEVTQSGYGHTDYVLLADDIVAVEESRSEEFMRLSNGFVIDKEKTFGELKFTAVRDVFLQNEDGTPSTHLKSVSMI